MHFFTSDEHFGHKNIIRYCNRPFQTVEEMDETIISNFNSVVSKGDITIHAGDFTLIGQKLNVYKKYADRLNGNHVFLKGSHDYWIPRKGSIQIWEKNFTINQQQYYFVVCHYAMKTWARSHFNSIQLYGHSHGALPPVGKQHDIGVDNNNFFPLSENQIVEIMKSRPDNPNLVKERHSK